jgi:hypothetical protein
MVLEGQVVRQEKLDPERKAKKPGAQEIHLVPDIPESQL